MDDPFKQHAEGAAALMGVMIHRMGPDSQAFGLLRVTAPRGYGFPQFSSVSTQKSVPYVHVSNYERAIYWMERLTRE